LFLSILEIGNKAVHQGGETAFYDLATAAAVDHLSKKHFPYTGWFMKVTTGTGTGKFCNSMNCFFWLVVVTQAYLQVAVI
jgi:hypothetical protein